MIVIDYSMFSYQNFGFFRLLVEKNDRTQTARANECGYLGYMNSLGISRLERKKETHTANDCRSPPYKVARKEGSKDRWTLEVEKLSYQKKKKRYSKNPPINPPIRTPRPSFNVIPNQLFIYIYLW